MKTRYVTIAFAFTLLAAILAACTSPSGASGGGGGAQCTTLASSIDTATTLPAGCYVTQGDVTVNADLTLKPGVTIAFAKDAGMTVNAGAALLAVGDPSNGGGIRLEGATDTAGFWQGLSIYGAGSDLEYVEVRDAGDPNYGKQVAVWVESGIAFKMVHSLVDYSKTVGFAVDAGGLMSQLTLQSNAYDHITGFPVSVPSDAAGALDGASVYGNNADNRVEVFGGDVTENQTWQKLGAPYLLDNAMTSVKAALTIQDGVKIEMAQDQAIDVGVSGFGTLTAVGPTAGITLIPDGTPTSGYWAQITIESNSSANHFSNVTVQGAGSMGTPDIDVINGGSLTIDNSTVEDSPVEAVCWDTASSVTSTNNSYPRIGTTGQTDCLP